mgnify:FL=1
MIADLKNLPFEKRARQVKKNQNREIIISAAREAFARKGYDNTSVREIIGSTNLGAGTFYNYFPDKLSVFKSINERIVSDFSSYFLAEIEKSNSFEEVIHIAFSSWFNWISNQEQHHLFIKNNKKYLLDLKWLSTKSKEYKIFYEKLLQFVIKLSKKTKFPDNDISFMVTSVIAVATSLGDEMLSRHDIEPRDATTFASKLFLKGL